MTAKLLLTTLLPLVSDLSRELPESERYRIPKRFRGRQYNAARDGSWAGTAKVLEYVSRQGLPGSCNPTGSYGQTGCFRKFLEQNRR